MSGSTRIKGALNKQGFSREMKGVGNETHELISRRIMSFKNYAYTEELGEKNFDYF